MAVEGGAAWSATVDWICVGSGAAGCTAAIAGHDQGFATLLLEQSPRIGGMTAHSAGILWVPCNHLLGQAGVEDSRQAALAYLRYTGAGENRSAYMEALVDNAARVVEYLHKHAAVELELADLAEFYYPASPGSKPYGRLLLCKPFPAETLGAWRHKVGLSPFHHSLSKALTGPNPGLGAGDGPHLGHSGPVRHTAGLAPWTTRPDWPALEAGLDDDEALRLAGASLAAHLFRAVLQRGIEVRTECRVGEVVVDGGRVTGVVVTHDGRTERIRATRGVVLGTNSGGDGWRLAVPADAAVTSSVVRQGLLGLQVPGETDLDGAPAMRGNYELRMRHSMVVNRSGQRFGNEWFFQDIGAKLHAFETGGDHTFTNLPCYLVFDQALLDAYSFGGQPPGTAPAPGWVARGDTLAELAAQVGMPAEALEATVDRFNRHVREGRDPDFGREPSSLGSLARPPFYGVELVAPPVSSGVIGLVTDTHGQVVHYRTAQPIPGLYACGPLVETDQALGVGYQAGCQLMLALLFGFLAAEQAAAEPA